LPVACSDGREARLDATLRPDDRRRKKVCRVEHPGPRRLECGARSRRSREGGSAAQAGVCKGLFVGSVQLPQALAELGLIDEYEFVVQPTLAGHGPTLFAGLSKPVDLKFVSRLEFGSGAVAMRYEPRR